jgi:ubiquinone/menaquinone biosynthesis C-methylase UbiE
MVKESQPLPASVARFTGFAEIYDQNRPRPPEDLSKVLTQMIKMPVPNLVIDLGCGTGLSTRYWAERAGLVIGVDPSPDMLIYARSHTPNPNVAYLFGYGHQVALANDCADIVTCSQSLHWMDAKLTLAEISRLLRPGGIFAVYDHILNPVLPAWEAETAYQAFQNNLKAIEERSGIAAQVLRWSKSEHLADMQACGHFRYTREVYLHHVEFGNADRLVGGALSYGQLQSLLKEGISASKLGLDNFREQVHLLLGEEPRPWYWSVHVRIGIT